MVLREGAAKREARGNRALYP